ncbi:MAG: Lpg1974 family pore-forming outer membrane protein [Chlamydiae bacterium]|nr:Lpg1974 family pore-forming outer membrane protein [Chlamydiota bacterium]
MKSLFRFSTSAILSSLLACSASVAADQMQAQPTPMPTPVTLGGPDYCFEVSFKAMALQAFANNLDYGAEAIPFDYGTTSPVLSPDWVIPRIAPEFHFGFDVGIAGMFHKTNSALMLNWERFHTPKDSNSFAVSDPTFMFGPFFEIGPDASFYKAGKGTVRFQFDEVNLDYGTFVDLGSRLHTNLFAGVSFSRIVEKRHTTFTGTDTGGSPVERTISVPAKFTGAGPQLGVDFTYKIVNGFQFVGNSRASLYVGKFLNNTTFTTTSNDLAALAEPSPNVQTTSVINKMGVVPGFEGSLGLAYEALFKKNYMFKFEAGYQAQIYINAIRSVDMGSEVALGSLSSIATQATGVYARSFERVVSDFGLAGPYVKIDFGF